jgi:hypothetical protein
MTIVAKAGLGDWEGASLPWAEGARAIVEANGGRTNTNTRATLRRNPGSIACAMRARYTHLLVDEFQDSNAVQIDLVDALQREVRHVTVVGDDAQSIYG